MKQSIFFYCLGFLFITTSIVFAGDSKRAAFIIDSAGVTTEVEDIYFSADKSRADLDWFGVNEPCIGVDTEIFHVAILIDSLISIELKKDTATVVYQKNGQEKTLIGKLLIGKFIGKSNYGDIELSTDKLKKITFKEDPPIRKAKNKNKLYNDTLVLTNGSRIPVADLERCSWTPSSMYIARNDPIHLRDIRFLRGESLLTIDFNKIKNISFHSDEKVTVTLKNGSTITGNLTYQEKARIVGFSGTYEEGVFFIRQEYEKNIKEIEFGN